MKYLIKLIIPLFFLVTITQSCEKDSISNDPLAISLTILNDYLIEMDAKSNGEFFEYLENNPNHTLDEIEEQGFVDRSIILKETKIVEAEINNREGEDIMEIASKIVDSRFIDNGEKQGFRICIFCCTGCLDRVKKNHCITQLFWTYGPGNYFTNLTTLFLSSLIRTIK